MEVYAVVWNVIKHINIVKWLSYDQAFFDYVFSHFTMEILENYDCIDEYWEIYLIFTTLSSWLFLVKRHNYINKCVWKTLLTMGVTNGVWSAVVEHVELPKCEVNTPLRKEFPLAPINKIATFILPLTLYICFVSMPTIKYKCIEHIPIMTQLPIP